MTEKERASESEKYRKWTQGIPKIFHKVYFIAGIGCARVGNVDDFMSYSYRQGV
jgi:hypothetical protein